MAEEITIEEHEARPVVEVAAETRLWKIPKVLASGFATARAHIEKSDAEVTGMPFARYLEVDWQAMAGKGAFGQFLDFLTNTQKMRIGMFSSQPVASDGQATGTEISEGRYVTTIHRGAYHKVGDTYRKIVDWAVENDVKLADSSIENYIDDPTEMPMAEVRTRIWIAVVD
ncbi:GyrI-like domain-containing protein [Parasphingorhabdus sp.]|uniref:GyrI-like domain-containing protein n=1 Tax=Parasphingorhabdus sp. TaxID=2709688 RepID=UPI003C747739